MEEIPFRGYDDVTLNKEEKDLNEERKEKYRADKNKNSKYLNMISNSQIRIIKFIMFRTFNSFKFLSAIKKPLNKPSHQHLFMFRYSSANAEWADEGLL